MIEVALEIGLRLEEFWAMTPHEFNLAIKAHGNRLKVQQRLLAWVQVNIINAWMPRGKKIRMRHILPETNGKAPEFLRGGGNVERHKLDEYMRNRTGGG